MAGPVVQGRTIRLLIETLEEIRDHGSPRINAGQIGVTADQIAVQVIPNDTADKLLLTGLRGKIWLEPGVNRNNLKDHMGELYRGAMSI